MGHNKILSPFGERKGEGRFFWTVMVPERDRVAPSVTVRCGALYLTVKVPEIASTAFARSVVMTLTSHFSPALALVGSVTSIRM